MVEYMFPLFHSLKEKAKYTATVLLDANDKTCLIFSFFTGMQWAQNQKAEKAYWILAITYLLKSLILAFFYHSLQSLSTALGVLFGAYLFFDILLF